MQTTPKSSLSVVMALSFIAAACHVQRSNVAPDTGATLVADSAQYTVRSGDGLYRASIGFRFTNHTGKPVSQSYCRAPDPPVLEKQRADGSWGSAYNRVTLTCLTLPPFRVENGTAYTGTLGVLAAQPGRNMVPVFEADSVPGIYRLRWEFRVGPDPDNRAAPFLQVVSPPFRMILP